MAADFSLKAHDRLPSIQADLAMAGLPAPLAQATGVRFVMRLVDGLGLPKVNAPAVIVDAAAGTVRYDWKAVDTDTPGVYRGEWAVLYTGNLPQTYPTLTYHSIEIGEDLDGV